MKKKLLIISFSPLNRDPRILRQISWLKDDFQITTIGYAASNVTDVRHLDYAPEVNKNLLVKLSRAKIFFSKNYEDFYWNSELLGICEKLSGEKFDVIIANDIETLPIASKIAVENTKLILDAHEYSPSEFDDKIKFRLFKKPLIEYICKNYLPRVDVAVTVCRGIADLYEREFGKKFSVITNAAKFHDLPVTETNPNKIRLIYHGIANQSRRTDLQIDLLKHLDDRFELNLMLVGEPPYIDNLKQSAENYKNINFLPPVEYDEIIPFTNRFDIGIFLLPPTNANYKFALPNKLFEYIQARLAIVISPSEEMQNLVKKYNLGAVSTDFSPESFAKEINNLTCEQIDFYKRQADKHAETLSAETNRQKFQRLLDL